MQEELKAIINKFLSGRFIFTIAVVIVFIVLSVTNRMPVDKVSEIILLVLYAYFSRSDRNKPDGETK